MQCGIPPTFRIHNVQVVELDPGNAAAVAKAAKLEPVVLERREKMKEEMIGADEDPPGHGFGLRSCWSRQCGTICPAPSQQRVAPVGSCAPSQPQSVCTVRTPVRQQRDHFL